MPSSKIFFAASMFLLGVFAIWLWNSGDTSTDTNIRWEGDKQIITITADGGYTPKQTIAEADVPTTLEFVTRGGFDCSSALVIPSLNYSTQLSSGAPVSLPLDPQVPGSTLTGLCAMGMYSFTIQFE